MTRRPRLALRSALPLGVLLVLAALPALARAQPGDAATAHETELVPRTALDGRVELLLPAHFARMDSAMVRLKYGGARPPSEVYTNEGASVNVALNHTADAVPPDGMGALHEALEGAMRTAYPTAVWNRSEVVERDGRAYVHLDLWTPTIDGKVRNVMLATSAEGRLLLVTFNAVGRLEPVWGPVGERIVASVRVRD
jgi:hypothetical protein